MNNPPNSFHFIYMDSQIHHLIHTLSQSEKRYFKVFAARNTSSANNLIRLFDALNAQQTYDENSLKNSFKNLASDKHYLLQQILKSMRSYHAEKSPEAIVSNLLQDARFLHQKSHYKQCRKILAKTKKLAQQYHLHAALIDIHEFERFDNKEIQTKKLGERIEQLKAERDANMRQLQIHHQVSDLFDRLFLLARKEYVLRDESASDVLERTISEAKAFEDGDHLMLRTRAYLAQVHAFYHQLKGDHQQAIPYFRKILALWETQPHLMQADRHNYQIALTNYLTACHNISDYSDFRENIEKLEQLPAETHDRAALQFNQTAYLSLLYFLNTQQFETAIRELVPKIQQGLKKYGEKIPTSRHLVYFYNMAILYFVVEDFSQAFQWINRILDHENIEHRQDLPRAARILFMILHFERGNYDLNDSAHRSTYMKLKRQAKLFPFEQAVMNTVRRLPDAKSSDEQKQIWQQLLADIDHLRTQPENAIAPAIEEISLWCRARIEGRSIREIATQS